MGCTASTDVRESRVSCHYQTQEKLDFDCKIELPKEFDASKLSIVLHEAIEKRNDETILRIFYKYSKEDYENLFFEFKKIYSIDIITLAFQNLSGTASEFLRLRLDPILKSICLFIYYHLRDRPPQYQEKILGILLGYQELNMTELAEQYFLYNGMTLQHHLQTSFKDEILEILLCQINQICDTRDPEDYFNPVDTARKLYEATISNQLVSGEKVLLKLVQTLPTASIKFSLEQYLQSFQRDIVVEIEKSLPQSEYRDLLVLSTKVIQNSQRHFTTQLNDLLKSNDEDARKQYYLMFYIMSRSENGIRDLKKAYQIHYFEPLQDEITELVTDPVSRSAIIKALSHVSSSTVEN